MLCYVFAKIAHKNKSKSSKLFPFANTLIFLKNRLHLEFHLEVVNFLHVKSLFNSY